MKAITNKIIEKLKSFLIEPNSEFGKGIQQAINVIELEENQDEHEMICNGCGQIIDMRDLSQVFAHESCDGTKKDYDNIKQISHSGALRTGSSELHTKNNGIISLN